MQHIQLEPASFEVLLMRGPSVTVTQPRTMYMMVCMSALFASRRVSNSSNRSSTAAICRTMSRLNVSSCWFCSMTTVLATTGSSPNLCHRVIRSYCSRVFLLHASLSYLLELACNSCPVDAQHNVQCRVVQKDYEKDCRLHKHGVRPQHGKAGLIYASAQLTSSLFSCMFCWMGTHCRASCRRSVIRTRERFNSPTGHTRQKTLDADSHMGPVWSSRPCLDVL